MKTNPHTEHFVQMIQQNPASIQEKNAKIMAADIPYETKQYLYLCLIRDAFIWCADYYHRHTPTCYREEIISCNAEFCSENLDVAQQMTVVMNSGAKWSQLIK